MRSSRWRLEVTTLLRASGLLLASSLAPLGCGASADRGPDTDIAALKSIHALVLQAHREGKVNLWMEVEADSYVVASRGEITFPKKSERRAARTSYLENTRFDSYRDLREAVVSVSDDGTLGWLIAQVEARGTRRRPDGAEDPVHFVSAWIELYRKEGGRWVLVGNVSNFRPSERP